MPASFRKVQNALLVNWLPLSDKKTFGIPYQQMIFSLNAFCTPAAVALRNGVGSIHFENLSIRTNNTVLPCTERGSGPMKSAHTIENGSS